MLKDYHIIFVPKDKRKTRTFKVSGLTLKVLLVTFILSIPLFFISILSMIHYQNNLIALKRNNYENKKLIENKQVLVGRLAHLEKKLSLIDDSIGHLGEIMDIDPQSLRFGTGPIDDMDYSLPEDFNEEFAGVGEAEEMIDDWMSENGNLTISKVNRKMNTYQDDVQVLSKKLEEIYAINRDKINYVNATPSTLPTEGWITSGFGMRKHPIGRSYRMHAGVDVASPVGTAVKAPASGRVVFAGRSGGYGQTLVLQHGYGITTIFAHLNKMDVNKGTYVKKGEQLGEVGNTGYSTGSHLHYEVHVDGIPTDPLAFVVQ